MNKQQADKVRLLEYLSWHEKFDSASLGISGYLVTKIFMQSHQVYGINNQVAVF